jgi:hypothetical protein
MARVFTRRRLIRLVVGAGAAAAMVAAFTIEMSTGERFIAVVAVLTLAVAVEGINARARPHPKLHLEVVNPRTDEVNTAPAPGSHQGLHLRLVNNGGGDAELAEVHYGWLPGSSVYDLVENRPVSGNPKVWSAGPRVVPAYGSLVIAAFNRAGSTDVQAGEIEWRAWAKGVREQTGSITVEPHTPDQ